MKFNYIFKKIAMILSITATTIILSACAAAAVTGVVAASGATSAYVMGTLRAEIKNATTVQIAEATKSTFHTLAIKTDEVRITEVDALVTGYTANSKKITVKIERITDNITELNIHVGYFGDEALSDLIYNEIIKKLNVKQNDGVETYAIHVEDEPIPTIEPSLSVEQPESLPESMPTPVSEAITPPQIPVIEDELESTPEPTPTPIPVLEAEPEFNSDPYTPMVVEEAEPAPAPTHLYSPSESEPSSDAMPIPATDL